MAQLFYSQDGQKLLDVRWQGEQYYSIIVFEKKSTGWIPIILATNWTEREIEEWKKQERANIVGSISTKG